MHKSLAGKHSKSLVPDALECSICTEIMLFPYVTTCGHSFCGTCLKHWFTNNQDTETAKTCPTCRERVAAAPVMVHALRELAQNVLESIASTNPAEAARARQNAGPDPGADAFADLEFVAAYQDAEDRVYRCQYCLWELEDGYCIRCHRHQQAGSDYEDEEEDIEVGAIDSVEESDANSLDSFIDDDEILEQASDESDSSEGYESDPDAISNIARRRLGRGRIVEINSSESEEEAQHTDSERSDDEVDEEDEDIGGEHMPIIISDSSSVMSESE